VQRVNAHSATQDRLSHCDVLISENCRALPLEEGVILNLEPHQQVTLIMILLRLTANILDLVDKARLGSCNLVSAALNSHDSPIICTWRNLACLHDDFFYRLLPWVLYTAFILNGFLRAVHCLKEVKLDSNPNVHGVSGLALMVTVKLCELLKFL